MEGWTTVMYIFQDVAWPPFVIFYFMSCVIICSFFILNLTIAVMLQEYGILIESAVSSNVKDLREYGVVECNVKSELVDFVIFQSNLTIGRKAKKILKD